MGCCCSKSNRKIVVALFDYTARDTTDISFNKRDRMEVLDDSEAEWWKVKHLTSRNKGLIPKNYVAEEGTVYCEDWFFDNVSRREAEKLLMVCEYTQGTFLIRPSEQQRDRDRFSLSVKDYDGLRRYHVKHYKIRPHKDGGYYIATNLKFRDLNELVACYSRNTMGLNHILTKPCPKESPILYDLMPSMRDDYEIDRSELRKIEKLGSGNFGEVYLGKWKNKTTVAIKTLRQGTMTKEAFLQEAAIMKKFRHNRLVALYAVCSKEEPVYIVQEYMCKGSLLDFLHGKEGKRLKHEELVYIASQIASGMEYLENQQLVHRDLAARNVLIGDKLIAKVADFGLARVIRDDAYVSLNACLPIRWTAPEALAYGRFTVKSDVWSYGILLTELFTYGRIPYCGLGNEEVAQRVERGYKMTRPPNIDNEIYDQITKCWEFAEEKRPTFEHLRYFFENFGIASELQYRDLNE